jgi:diguanylate cyclase
MDSSWIGRENAVPLPGDVSAPVVSVPEKEQFYLHTILALFRLIREFSLDLTELNADAFKERNHQVAELFKKGEALTNLENRFESHKDVVLAYIDREKAYFLDRDSEFKNIIELLISGMTDINKENKEFNVRIYDKNVKLEEIIELNDIRQIKEGIKQEVAQIKEHIQDKQAQDSKHMDELSRNIAVLKIDLEKARHDSLTDGLTGAMNRLAFDTNIRERVNRSEIVWKPFALLMMDVDNFKQVNDRYGHAVGDRVLLALVEMAKSLTRKDDFIARYGGEEFAIILSETSFRQAMKKAQLLCKSIAKTDYQVDDVKPDEKLSFTVSIGVSILHQGDSVESVINRADKAMYEAKHLGKNQVVGAEKASSSFMSKLWF